MNVKAGMTSLVGAWLFALVSWVPLAFAQGGDGPDDSIAWIDSYPELFADSLPLRVEADATITIWIREGESARPLASSKGY